jgi:hypothetical protein
MVNEKEPLPELLGNPGAERPGDQQAKEDVDPDRRPVHHEVVAGGGEPLGRADPRPDGALGDGHVHVGVALHAPHQATVGLGAGLVDQSAPHEDAEQQGKADDH